MKDYLNLFIRVLAEGWGGGEINTRGSLIKFPLYSASEAYNARYTTKHNLHFDNHYV